jgi:hypothetical protein
LTRAKEKATPASKVPDQIEDNDPPVKVTSHGHIAMGDEKKVLYRKQEPSSGSISPAKNVTEGSHHDSDDESEITLYGEEKFTKLKKYMIKQIDLLEEEEIKQIKFEYDAEVDMMHFQCWK